MMATEDRVRKLLALAVALIVLSLGIALMVASVTSLRLNQVSGTYHVVVGADSTWDFKYFWTNINQTSVEEVVKYVGREYEKSIRSAVASGAFAVIVGKNLWADLRYGEPHYNTIFLTEGSEIIVGLNVINVEPSYGYLEAVITRPWGSTIRFTVNHTDLPKYIYTEVLKSGMYEFKLINKADRPITLTVQAAKGYIIFRRPYFWVGMLLLATSIALHAVIMRRW
ncbi:MAG: hypothetical protein J7J11_03760 [Desulfurococcales archaeon]|nr:hypothetical protein [Desulfurococcales archaeon]